jgi:hypothetical protein
MLLEIAQKADRRIDQWCELRWFQIRVASEPDDEWRICGR